MIARLLWAVAAVVTLGCFSVGTHTVEHRIVLENKSATEMVVRSDGEVRHIAPGGSTTFLGGPYQIEVRSDSGDWLPYDPEDGEIYPPGVRVPKGERYRMEE